MSRFISVDRSTEYLLPPSVQDWLPENHLARFVVDVVERLDLSALIKATHLCLSCAICLVECQTPQRLTGSPFCASLSP